MAKKNYDFKKKNNVVLKRQNGFSKPPQQTVKTAPGTLIITNLAFGITNNEVYQLFAEFGPIKRAVVHFDALGRSMGTGDVVFFKMQDAVRAMKAYNGATLDGRVMKIKIAVEEITGGTGKKTPKVGWKTGNSNHQNQGRLQRRKLQAKQPTKEELDAELDAFMKERKGSNKNISEQELIIVSADDKEIGDEMHVDASNEEKEAEEMQTPQDEEASWELL
ncbi:hypothetical protein NQ315_007020 [Exocentrus adspersus]|uniref:RRM domain-containing protein n=1 Tax=Exocentrus adspersus TaxID=1586481 RepID=A0AAV8WCG7_9CUCU|nr:hypothetical protein NQ315_007020 [Exocentrus adspersus]